jgi:hypothetical protein
MGRMTRFGTRRHPVFWAAWRPAAASTAAATHPNRQQPRALPSRGTACSPCGESIMRSRIARSNPLQGKVDSSAWAPRG